MKENLNELKHEELLEKKEDLSKKIRELRFDQVMGHVENPLEIRTIRRKIARVNTLIHQNEAAARKA